MTTLSESRPRTSALEQALRFCQQEQTAFVDDLKKLVAIPSVSFAGFPPEEVKRSAEGVCELLRRRGLENVEILELEGAHPYVYADWLHAPGKPTLLLYAHHDVQPPGREELWKSPPFEATERDGRLYGRGAADDKAGVVVHSSAIAAYLSSNGKLPLNIKVIIEGEEECGSDHLEEFLRKYAGKVQADVMVLTDTGNYDVGIPSVTTALRGLVAADVTVRSMSHPLHSGMWGGPIPDPVIALSKMIASLTDEDGRIAIKGIFDQVKPMTRMERKALDSLKYSEESLRKQSGLLPTTRIVGGKGGLLEKGWRLPSLSVNAIQASSRKECANVINEIAWCHIGIRIVPNMDPNRTKNLLLRHLKAQIPWGMQVEFTNVSASKWWYADPSGPVFEAAARALSLGYCREMVPIGCGGSIPFVGPFSRALDGAPALLIGVEDPFSNPHSENESLHLGDFQKAIRSAVHLYQELSCVTC